MRHTRPLVRLVIALVILGAIRGFAFAQAQTSCVSGRVVDETAGALPGVTVELRGPSGAPPAVAVTTLSGEYSFDNVASGTYEMSFALLNFASQTRRDVVVHQGPVRVDVKLRLTLTAEVTVSTTRTFSNLEDMENPEETLVGVAQSASQGAITARQLAERPSASFGSTVPSGPFWRCDR